MKKPDLTTAEGILLRWAHGVYHPIKGTIKCGPGYDDVAARDMNTQDSKPRFNEAFTRGRLRLAVCPGCGARTNTIERHVACALTAPIAPPANSPA